MSVEWEVYVGGEVDVCGDVGVEGNERGEKDFGLTLCR